MDLRFHVFESFIEKDGDGRQCEADHGNPDDGDFDAEEGGGGLLSVGDVAGSAEDPAPGSARRGTCAINFETEGGADGGEEAGARMPVFHSP